jgi:ferredoxin
MTTNVDNNKCDRCGTCICVCPSNALLLLSDKLSVDNGRCTGCGLCVQICPFGALSLAESPGTKKP